MVKSYRHIVRGQASNLEKACNYLRATLGDSIWLQKLTDAADTIRTLQTKGDEWTVEIEDMDLPIDGNPRHLKPNTLKNNLKLFVSIKMKGNGKKWDNNEDCIEDLCFSVRIQEKDQTDPDNVYQMGFHIDKVGDGDDKNEMHPLYHVHFVNESKAGEIESLGMDVPRLSHHPVDLFLGLMLVFANFNKEAYEKLKENGNFIGLCMDSANHIITPYYSRLAAPIWGEGNIGEFEKSLCPYLAL